jgi:hypothetical protein
MYARFSMNVMHGNSKALKATASVSPGKLGSFRKKPRRRSHRFYLGGFRRRTPGPPPFSVDELDAGGL